MAISNCLSWLSNGIFHTFIQINQTEKNQQKLSRFFPDGIFAASGSPKLKSAKL